MSTNQIPVAFKFNNNLLKKLSYNYTVEGLGGNWPATLTPMSGSFTPQQKTATVSGILSFCVSTGVCNDGLDVLPYDDPKKCSLDTNDKYTYVRAVATLADDPSYEAAYSEIAYVSCLGCVPSTKVTLPENIRLNAANGNRGSFIINISGLIPNETYYYNFEGMNTNWPIKLSPISGSFVAQGEKVTIPSKITFCESTGLFPNGTSGVLPYVVDNNCTKSKLGSIIRCSIDPARCDLDNSFSNYMSVECNDCIPKLAALLPSSVTLTKTIGYNYELSAIVEGMIPSRQYSYRFKSVNANWPIVLSSATGIVPSKQTTDCVKSSITFCRNTGVCLNGASNVLNHTITDICLRDKTKIVGEIVMEIDPIDCAGETITSNVLTINCNDCLPTEAGIVFNNSNISTNKDQVYTLITSLSNLEPKKEYSYVFSSVGGDWPVYMNSVSGFVKSNSTSAQIQTELTLCSSTGICPVGSVGILNYTVSNNSVKKYNKYKNMFKLTLSEVDCPTNSYKSNIVTVQCLDCNIQSNGPKLLSVDIQ